MDFSDALAKQKDKCSEKLEKLGFSEKPEKMVSTKVSVSKKELCLNVTIKTK